MELPILHFPSTFPPDLADALLPDGSTIRSKMPGLRVRLSEVGEEHLHDLFLLRGNIEAMRYLDRPMTYTLEDARNLYDRTKAMEVEKTGIQLGIFLGDAPTMIGTIGFFRMHYDSARTEIGYMLQPRYWRQGIATEAMQVMLYYGFEVMNFHRIEADINPDNDASIALCRKLGFRQEAHLRQNFYFGGRFTDTVIMGLLKSDFRQQQAD